MVPRFSFATGVGRWTVAALLVALLAPSTALGQDSEKAKKYYQRGMKAFYEENYAMAVTNFKRANSIEASGTLLFNISLAYSRMGKPEEAMEYSQKAADRDDLPEDTVTKNRARMAGYTAAMSARDVAGEAGAASAQAQNSSDTGNQSGGSQPTTTDTSGGSGGGHGLMWAGGGLGLLGAGAISTALVMNFNVRGKIEEKREAEDAQNYEKAGRLYDEIDQQQTVGRILVYSGAGAMAVGTVLFIVDLASSGPAQSRTVRMIGGPTRDGWSVGLDVRF